MLPVGSVGTPARPHRSRMPLPPVTLSSTVLIPLLRESAPSQTGVFPLPNPLVG